MERANPQEERISTAIQALKAAEELIALLDRMCVACVRQDIPLIDSLRYQILSKRTMYEALRKRFEK
jgi:hypothetical protein